MNPNDFINRTEKQLFFVYGYAQTGSGSLTFPEDFDFVGVVSDEEEAKRIVKRMNEKILEEEGITLEEEEEDDREDEMTDALQDADAYRYDYDRLSVIHEKV